MKIQKTSLIALLAAGGLLALSQGLSAQSTNAPARPPGQGGPGGGRNFSVDDRLARLTEQLSLTDEQKPKVKAVLEEQNKQFAEWRDLPPEERRSKMQGFRDEMNKKMKAILTEEQFKKFEALPRGGRGQGQGGQGGQGEPRGERPNATGGGSSTNAPKP